MSFMANNTSSYNVSYDTLPTRQPKFLPKFVQCVLGRNVIIVLFRIINFESGCSSFNKMGDFVFCEMDANFQLSSQRKILSSSNFIFKSPNLELLSFKLV